MAFRLPPADHTEHTEDSLEASGCVAFGKG